MVLMSSVRSVRSDVTRLLHSPHLASEESESADYGVGQTIEGDSMGPAGVV